MFGLRFTVAAVLVLYTCSAVIAVPSPRSFRNFAFLKFVNFVSKNVFITSEIFWKVRILNNDLQNV